MLLAVDVGNSGVKTAAFEGDHLVAAGRLPPGRDPARFLGVDADVVKRRVAVSVSEGVLAGFLAGAGRGFLVLGVDLPIRIENRSSSPEETGHDRLANAAAAFAIAKGAAVVVDLGSAVTVDAVSADGAFSGGSIAPGRPAFAAGLRIVAPALPALPEGRPPPGIPRNTLDALRAGTVYGLAGLVDRLVRESVAALVAAGEGERDCPVYLTGGDATIVAPFLTFPAAVEPHLVLRGVALLARRALGEVP